MTLFVIYEKNIDTQAERIRAILTSDLAAYEATKLLEAELASGIRGDLHMRFFIDEFEVNRVMVRTGPFNWEIHFLGDPIELHPGVRYGVSPKGEIVRYADD